MGIWRKCYLTCLKECQWTTYQLAEQFSEKNQSAMHKNSKLRDFIIQMDGLKAIPGEEKAVTPEMTSSW